MTLCPDCGTQRGDFHRPGCSFEQCRCGGVLIHCQCLALPDAYALEAIAYIAESVSPHEARQQKAAPTTYYGAAISARQITWLYENGSPKAKTRIKELLDTGAIIDLGTLLVMTGIPQRQREFPVNG
jgi:hypothetical protein